MIPHQCIESPEAETFSCQGWPDGRYLPRYRAGIDPRGFDVPDTGILHQANRSVKKENRDGSTFLR